MEKYSQDVKILIKGPLYVKSYRIKEGTEIIEGRAFQESEVENIIIPDSVKFIHESAFRNCKNLTSIILPASLEKLGEGVFAGCTSLKKVTFQSYIPSIEAGTFEGCDQLEEVILPSGLKKIGRNAFYECKKLKNLIIPDSVLEIGERAFKKCGSLISILLPSQLNEIKEHLFDDCCNLQEIIIPETVKKIDNASFFGCTSLSKIQFPANLDSIGFDVFCHCENLTNLELPEGIRSIPFNAFSFCKRLKYITLPSTLKIIQENAFRDCENLIGISLPNGLTTIGANAFFGNKSLKGIEFSDNIKNIKSEAFAKCLSLENIYLPSSIKNIEPNIFNGCKNLQVIYISENLKNTSLSSSSFWLGCNPSIIIEKSKSYVIITCDQDVDPEIDRLILRTEPPTYITLQPGENILTVEEYPALIYGFEQEDRDEPSSSILKIDLSNFDGANMTSMEKMFANLQSEINFGELNTNNVKNITGIFDHSAFPYLKPTFSLKNVKEWGSFDDAYGIVTLDLTDWNNKDIIDHTQVNIYDVELLILDGWKLEDRKQANIFVNPYTRYYDFCGKVSLKGCDKDTVIWISEALLKSISEYHDGPLDISNYLILDDNLKVICHKEDNSITAHYIFSGDQGCVYSPDGKELIKVNTDQRFVFVKYGVEIIGKEAFKDCEILFTVVLPETIKEIGDYAFSGCSELENINIPDSVISIGEGAFEFCSKLSALFIGKGLKKIGEMPFLNSGLKTLHIPFLKHIYNSFFEGCLLENLTFYITDVPFESNQISRLKKYCAEKFYTNIYINHKDNTSALSDGSIYDYITTYDKNGNEKDEFLTAIWISSSTVAVKEGVQALGKGCLGSGIFSLYLPETIKMISKSANENNNNLLYLIVKETFADKILKLLPTSFGDVDIVLI